MSYSLKSKLLLSPLITPIIAIPNKQHAKAGHTEMIPDMRPFGIHFLRKSRAVQSGEVAALICPAKETLMYRNAHEIQVPTKLPHSAPLSGCRAVSEFPQLVKPGLIMAGNVCLFSFFGGGGLIIRFLHVLCGCVQELIIHKKYFFLKS